MLLLLAVLTVGVRGDGTASVELVYRLERAQAATMLPFTILEVRGVRILSLTADGTAVELDRSNAPQLRGTLDAEDGVETITFRYEVLGTTIPVVVLGGSPVEARAGAFRAEIDLADGLHLLESFPTGFRKVAPTGYALELPVVPAFVKLRVSESASVFTLPRIVDGSVLVLLALLVGLAAVAIRRR